MRFTDPTGEQATTKTITDATNKSLQNSAANLNRASEILKLTLTEVAKDPIGIAEGILNNLDKVMEGVVERGDEYGKMAAGLPKIFDKLANLANETLADKTGSLAGLRGAQALEHSSKSIENITRDLYKSSLGDHKALGKLSLDATLIALTDAVSEYGAELTEISTTKYVNLASEQRTTHIIAGDATGGGHAWFGSFKSFMNGLSGQKSMFPMSWSNEKIMNAVSDVVVNNPWIQQTGKAGATLTKSGQPVRYSVEGVYDGTKIKVITTQNDIITAFPMK